MELNRYFGNLHMLKQYKQQWKLMCREIKKLKDLIFVKYINSACT